jgi:Polycystin cation channel
VIAVRRGLPTIARLIITSIPIFMGYAFFGMVVFSQVSDEFVNLDRAVAALFSTINGDSLYSRFIVIDVYFPWVVRIYEYSFVCIGAYAIINIFIAVIYDEYQLCKDVRCGVVSCLQSSECSAVVWYGVRGVVFCSLWV